MAAIDIALWVATGLVAAIYLFAATMKLFKPDMMREQSKVLAALEGSSMRNIAIAELAGVAGILVPAIIDQNLWVAGAAATGLALIQALAIPRHIKMDDAQGLPFNIFLLLAATFVALGRFGVF